MRLQCSAAVHRSSAAARKVYRLRMTGGASFVADSGGRSPVAEIGEQTHAHRFDIGPAAYSALRALSKRPVDDVAAGFTTSPMAEMLVVARAQQARIAPSHRRILARNPEVVGASAGLDEQLADEKPCGKRRGHEEHEREEREEDHAGDIRAPSSPPPRACGPGAGPGRDTLTAPPRRGRRGGRASRSRARAGQARGPAAARRRGPRSSRRPKRTRRARSSSLPAESARTRRTRGDELAPRPRAA